MLGSISDVFSVMPNVEGTRIHKWETIVFSCTDARMNQNYDKIIIQSEEMMMNDIYSNCWFLYPPCLQPFSLVYFRNGNRVRVSMNGVPMNEFLSAVSCAWTVDANEGGAHMETCPAAVPTARRGRRLSEWQRAKEREVVTLPPQSSLDCSLACTEGKTKRGEREREREGGR